MDYDIPNIRPFEERRYEKIPTDKIKVINSRDRDKEQFEKYVRSIAHNGQLKPIVVNDKFLERGGTGRSVSWSTGALDPIF